MKRAIIADFEIAKWGGIVENTAGVMKAFKELGYEIDYVQLCASRKSQRQYDKKVAEFESGEHQRSIKFHSQAGGYQKDEATGYWRNSYYGFFLPPSNSICVWDDDALDLWHNKVDGVDIIVWNFMPTVSSAWEKKDRKFDFWYKFFDLPSTTKQVFYVHDGYFDIRSQYLSALKDKILFLGGSMIAAYRCCEEFGIPNMLWTSARWIPEKMPINNHRKVNFFAAHMFKSMKHMEELIAAIPYLEDKSSTIVAGTGIEYSYMTSETKCKSNYMCSCKRDPQLPKELDGKVSIWNRGIEYGMQYRGQMAAADVKTTFLDTKFAIDPSWCKHYAQYGSTHINGFITEAILGGAYPVLRDYRGLVEHKEELYDPMFDNIRAIYIPWDATPKQFADALNEALHMPQSKFLKDTLHNFEFAREIFNTKKNVAEIIRLCEGGKELVHKELYCGKLSKRIKDATVDVMTNYFGIELPIEWETD